ncbi:unnamed protein product, partial [Allacma fusca]
LDQLENRLEILQIDRSERDADVRAKFLQIENTLTTMETNIARIEAEQTILKRKTATIESDNAKIKTNVTNSATPESFLKMLPPPANGYLFRGSTFEQIAAALPSHSMAVQIDKTDTQCSLTFLHPHETTACS